MRIVFKSESTLKSIFETIERRTSRFNLIDGVKIPSRRFCDIGVFSSINGKYKHILVALIPLEKKTRVFPTKNDLEKLKKMMSLENGF